MRRSGRIISCGIAIIMAVTCFVPMMELSYAATEETEPTTAADPDANYTGMKDGLYYENGKLYTGWLKNKEGKKYYLKKGKRAKGWIKVKGKNYYCNKNGFPFKGIKKVKKTRKNGNKYSVWCEFNKKSGVYKRTIGDDMDKKAQKYKSNKKYLILVSYKKHRVRVYKGKKNKWTRIKDFKCSMGKGSTPTPRGEYRVTSKGRYFNTGSNARCWYWTGFISSIYLFHSVIYNRNSSPSHVLDGRLGMNISHGCIRLKLENARWIYYNVPSGSKVVIKYSF